MLGDGGVKSSIGLIFKMAIFPSPIHARAGWGIKNAIGLISKIAVQNFPKIFIVKKILFAK